MQLWYLANRVFNRNSILLILFLFSRLKRGVLATVWQVIKGRNGVELDAFPSVTDHVLADCDAIQNAVDCHLDHLVSCYTITNFITSNLRMKNIPVN